MERDAPWTAWSKTLQPHEEVSRKMRDTAGGTPALPFEEADSSFSPNHSSFSSTSMFNVHHLCPNNL
jgi:hypothetical protein